MSDKPRKNELLLENDQLIILQTRLAVLVGDRQAMALQQIHYWSSINQKADKVEHYIDDQWWVYNTWREWRENNFPFWSLSMIRRIFADLEAEGLIVTRPHENKNKGCWVTINYGMLELLVAQQKEAPRVKRLKKRAESRSAQVEQTSQSGVRSAQNEQTGLLKLNRRSAQVEQDTGNTENTETTTERKEIAPASADAPSNIVEFPEGPDIAPEVYRGLGMPGLAAKAEKAQSKKQAKLKRDAVYTHPLWQAFRNEWPENARPIVSPRSVDQFAEVIELLEEAGVTPARVAALARKRLDAGKTGYSFLFVPEDIHEIPLSGEEPKRVSKPRGIWSQAAPDTAPKSNLTPEERAALVANGRAAKAAAMREANAEKKVG